jgi:hypothetical protein
MLSKLSAVTRVAKSLLARCQLYQEAMERVVQHASDGSS